MKAYVTSIGEITTGLCLWSLERLGLETILIKGKESLWDKLKLIYEMADDDFYRVDADVVANMNIMKLDDVNNWWIQAAIFEWYRMDKGYGGIQLIRKQCLPILRKHIAEAEGMDRPETYLSRLPEFHNPRRFESVDFMCGIHGFKQDDFQRIKDQKERRGQHGDYDWDLAKRMNAL